MKIFITGAAKSGTTLLARLMHSFDMPINAEEITISDLCKSDYGNVVGKRTEYSIFSNILQRKDLNRQKKLIKKHHITVINIYRNGVDVLESFERDWGYWNPHIWCESIRQMHAFPDLIRVNVKYEDLVRFPDDTQQQISKKIGKKFQYKFSEYVEKAPEGLFPTTDERYKIRPIVTDRIQKRFDINKPGIDIDYFNKQMESLGYEQLQHM